MTPFEQGFLDELEKIAGMLARLAKTRKATGVVKEVPGLKAITPKQLAATPTMREAGKAEMSTLGEATTVAPGGVSTSPEKIKELLKRRKQLKELPKIKPPSKKTQWKFVEVK